MGNIQAFQASPRQAVENVLPATAVLRSTEMVEAFPRCKDEPWTLIARRLDAHHRES